MVRHEQDWVMRQVQMLVQFITCTILDKDHISYEVGEELTGETGELYNRLKELLRTDNICDAEDMLHDGLNESEDYLKLTMWFYSEINMLTDEELEAAGFSREEVYQGLQDVLRRDHIVLPIIE